VEESRRRTLLLGGGGILAVVALWWLLALTLLSGHHVPTPVEVLHAFRDDGWEFYRTQFSVTLQEAVKGFLIGTISAVLLSAVVLLLPLAEPVVMQVAVITYCIPIVAIAPVLSIVIGAPDAGEPSGTAVALAALSVFFTTVVGSVLGFRSADRASLDLVQVYGGGRLQQLRKVQLVAALPGILSALQIAAPAAFLGAILGEFAGGGIERGVGPALVQAQTTLNSGTAWAIGLACALMAGIGYAIFGLLARLVTPWSKGTA
jgi:ABC-type nitrate/sulfonate/bicarbonate transport system permease component